MQVHVRTASIYKYVAKSVEFANTSQATAFVPDQTHVAGGGTYKATTGASMFGALGRKFGVWSVLMSSFFLVTTGCDIDGGGSSGGGGGSDTGDFVGSWAIYDQTAPPGTAPWYLQVKDDGTWYFSGDEAGTDVQSGIETYTVNDGVLVGGFTNPNAGDGRIEATIDDNGTLHMDFIEYWHEPYKVVPYTGVKL